MHTSRRKRTRSLSWGMPGQEAWSPTTPRAGSGDGRGYSAAGHPLAATDENGRLHEYEQRVKEAFDTVVPLLKRVSAVQHEEDFVSRAQAMAREILGFEFPSWILEGAWLEQLDMRRLYAFCVFEIYHRFCDDFFRNDPLGLEPSADAEFQRFLQDCGFHLLDISPCSDGRLAHVVRYVLRLPLHVVRRKSYAGAIFDIEENTQKWIETEMLRYREGRPNTADAPTRYLKVVIYHFSELDPAHAGCAAHGSDAHRAAKAGLDRLYAFKEAIENGFCCGASIDLLLIGVNTDDDAIRIHVPDEDGAMEIDRFLDVQGLYNETYGMSKDAARESISRAVRDASPGVADGMARLIERCAIGNISQIDYIHEYFGDHYPDIDHAERFIGVGVGFEEIRLRNLTYFAYLRTVEEAATDLDVGIKIFRKLNLSQGLPVPIVVRFDYHGEVPGARERAIERSEQVANALRERYQELFKCGLLHTLKVVRDCGAGEVIEVVRSSVDDPLAICGGGE